MMYHAIKFICDELDTHLRRIFYIESESVFLASVHEPDGSISFKTTDKIIVTLVNMSESFKAESMDHD